MRTLRKNAILLYLVLMHFSVQGQAQNSEAKAASDTFLINAAREIMNSAGSCALITLDEEGCPRVRAMDPFAPESDFTIWFGTNQKSRKVNQIKHDPRVTLYYLDGDGSGYVMIHGTAQLIDDAKEKEARWKKEWEAFYPNQKENYLLIRVSPLWMEVSSATRGITGDSVSWEPPQVQFNTAQ